MYDGKSVSMGVKLIFKKWPLLMVGSGFVCSF